MALDEKGPSGWWTRKVHVGHGKSHGFFRSFGPLGKSSNLWGFSMNGGFMWCPSCSTSRRIMCHWSHFLQIVYIFFTTLKNFGSSTVCPISFVVNLPHWSKSRLSFRGAADVEAGAAGAASVLRQFHGGRDVRKMRIYGGFQSHRGTPSHHPFLVGFYLTKTIQLLECHVWKSPYPLDQNQCFLLVWVW